MENYDEIKQEIMEEQIKLLKEQNPEKLADQHVDWFLKIIRPLLIEHFVHGYKHGRQNR